MMTRCKGLAPARSRFADGDSFDLGMIRFGDFGFFGTTVPHAEMRVRAELLDAGPIVGDLDRLLGLELDATNGNDRGCLVPVVVGDADHSGAVAAFTAHMAPSSKAV